MNHSLTLWLRLAITALLFAGFLTIVIICSRVPIIQNFFPLKDFFHTALIVHVNLSVVFWMLIMNILISILHIPISKELVKPSLILTSIFLILFCSSAFLPSDPILNNYIPMLDGNDLYSLSLTAFFAINFILSALFTGKSYMQKNANISTFLVFTANSLILTAFATMLLTAAFIMPQIEDYQAYEYLFWGFGHVLQFVYVTLLMSAWIYLLGLEKETDQALYIIVAIHLITGFGGILIFAKENLLPAEYISYFTEQMIIFGSASPILLLIYLILKRKIHINTYSLGLYFSAGLFCYGGMIALLIKGSNTIIPAHYHGSTIGVTIALMFVGYYVIKEKLHLPLPIKLVKIQAYTYISGQILHITGLAISGGYGALRKSTETLENHYAKFWMGIMGLGGLLALIGGFLFIYICYKAGLFNQLSKGKDVKNKNIQN